MTVLAEAADRPPVHGAAPKGRGDKARFGSTTVEIEQLAEPVLAAALGGGASAAETEVSQGVGQSVTVRKGEVKTIAYNRDKGIAVTVYG